MTRTTKQLLGMFFAALVLLAAIAVEISLVNSLIKTRAAVHWPTTKGVILKSTLDSQPGVKTSYEVHIEYQYRAGEKEYKSKQVRARGTGSKIRNEVAPLVDHFPVGKEVVVHYNPTNPADALLVVGADETDYLVVIFPVLFMAIPILALIAFFIQWRKGPQGAIEAHEDDESIEPPGYRTKGPRVRFYCSGCKTEVDGLSYRIHDKEAIPHQIDTFVECIPCGITRMVRLPLEELDQYSANEITASFFSRVSFVVKFLAIASVVFFLMPFLGMILGGAGLLGSYRLGGWPKRVSQIGLALSTVVTLIFVVLLITVK